jgi:hypothetical protein
MGNTNRSHISNVITAPIKEKHSYELPPTTIHLDKHNEYVFSLCYNIETNNDDGKIHYYFGIYRKQKNGEPVFDYLVDTETNKYFGKKTIENFVLLKPQIIKWMGVVRGKIRKGEEMIKETHDKERKEMEEPGLGL